MTIDIFRSDEVDHLRKDDVQQAAPVKKIEPDGGFGAEDNFVQFVGDPFLGNDLYPRASAVMAFSVLSSMVKSSWLAKRMARIMRNGSSLKVRSGSSGVRISFFSRSFRPSKGSIRRP
jgi:hypothetical protein